MFYFWAPSSKCNRLVRGETDPGAVVHKYSLHRLDSGLEWKLEGKETLARGAGAQLQVGWFWPAANRLAWPGSNSEIMTVFSLPCLALPCPAWVPGCLGACLGAAASWPVGTKSSPNTFPVSLSARVQDGQAIPQRGRCENAITVRFTSGNGTIAAIYWR